MDRKRVFYRYHVAHPGVRVDLNRYGWKVIGIYAVLGRHAYCATWRAA